MMGFPVGRRSDFLFPKCRDNDDKYERIGPPDIDACVHGIIVDGCISKGPGRGLRGSVQTKTQSEPGMHGKRAEG